MSNSANPAVAATNISLSFCLFTCDGKFTEKLMVWISERVVYNVSSSIKIDSIFPTISKSLSWNQWRRTEAYNLDCDSFYHHTYLKYDMLPWFATVCNKSFDSVRRGNSSPNSSPFLFNDKSFSSFFCNPSESFSICTERFIRILLF